jgi:hypothetical protein
MSANNQSIQRSIAAESDRLVDLAAKVVRYRLPSGCEFAHAKNIAGVRDGPLSFSSRTDSLTVFARNDDYGLTREAGAYTGSEKLLISRLRGALRAAEVPLKEVSAIEVQDELGRAAERTSNGRYRIEEPQLLARVAIARRAIGGLPVWSSAAALGLTKDRTVGDLQIHWPEVSKAVLREARLLADFVAGGWQPPEQKGARQESLEAGVVHSPAVSFFLDMRACVRVIYGAEDPTLRRKLVLHLDRHGEPIPVLRTIEGPDERQSGPRQVASSSAD